jgi:hypothetical protein
LDYQAWITKVGLDMSHARMVKQSNAGAAMPGVTLVATISAQILTVELKYSQPLPVLI